MGNDDLTGFIHSYESGGAVDGPGVRFVLFMGGCQMRCLYCHNPDTWTMQRTKPQTVTQTVDDIGKYARFVSRTGGLTISGGEPLMQAEFVGAVMAQVKRRYNLHIALDTNGALAGTLADDWFDPVDLVLLDLKHIDPVKHKALTGMDIDPVLNTARRLADLNKTVWIRYVLVPGWSDDFDDVEKMADFVAALGNVEKVEVLPFHNMGAFKWQELAGADYQLADTPAPTPQLELRVRQQFAQRGLAVS